ncbi:molybdopterin-dependent oxidoreductase [Chloroflexota bacterium]
MGTENRGKTTFYTSCTACSNAGQCVLKVHIKDGAVVAVEPDDRLNKNIGREDAVLSERDLMKANLQRRPCAKGLVLHKYISLSDRILYPLKRVQGTRRGEGKYTRISWEEALITIAAEMKRVREKYGAYSIISPFPNLPDNQGLGRLFSLWGAGVAGWGNSSYDSIRLMGHIVAGVPDKQSAKHTSSSAADMLANSKVIVLWGHDPTLGSFGPGNQFSWYVKLARERGKRVIIIDPRYTVAAEVLADQWIPIKPGTDLAMFLAMAYVLLKEDLWDKEFVARYVEPDGFEKWRRYILGTDDGIEKTPEWAEKKCAVPAETIVELTRLVATNKPSWLWSNWAVSRKSWGEQIVQGFAALQALLGFWGVPGAGPPINIGPGLNIPVHVPWGPSGNYKIPRMYRGHYWAQAVLLLDKVKNGELSQDEYMRIVGWRADPSLLKEFNPKMVFQATNRAYASNFLVTATDSTNDQIKALDRMEFIASTHTMMTPTVRYADIILPSLDSTWEEENIAELVGTRGFASISYCPGALKPPGEAKSWIWIYMKLAEKLGIDPKEYFSYYTTDENWEKDIERFVRASYEKVIDHYKKRNIDVPLWDEFSQGKFINCDELEDRPFVGWEEQMTEGKSFQTASGKIEVYSEYVGNKANQGKDEHVDSFGQLYEHLPSNWGELAPMAVYRTTVRGMDDPLVKKYPLMLLSPHPRYRNQSAYWNHPWLRDHIYRHRVWISPSDARTRNIEDNDLVKVHNDRGEVVMPAYVTSRVMPGIVVLHHGGWYTPDASGVDHGASPSTLLGGDFTSGTTPAKTTGLVEVEKYQGED